MRSTWMCVAALLAVMGSAMAQDAGPLAALPSGSAELVLPVITDAAADSGTVSRVDLTIRNMRDTAQYVQIYSIVKSANVRSAKFVALTLLPFETRTLEGFEGTGDLSGPAAGWMSIVGAPDGANIYDDADPKARLAATCRIYTAEPGGDRTTSQSSNPDDPGTQYLRFPSGTISGLRQDAAFRTTVTIWNQSTTEPRTFRVTAVGNIRGRFVREVVVQRAGIERVPLPSGEFGALRLTVEALGLISTGNGLWTAYGTTTDNVTGDTWLQSIVPDDGS